MPLEMSFTICDDKCFAKERLFDFDWTLARTMNAPMIGQAENPLAHPNCKKADLLWVCEKDSSVIGFVGLASIDFKNRHCEIIFCFQTEPSSYIQLAARHAFKKLGLAKVHCLAPAGNPACLALEKIGFTIEAVMRKHCLVDGEFVDVNWYGLPRSECDREND